MRARENNLWRWLDKYYKHPMLQMTRVESQDYPDVSGCFDGCAFLIALKSVSRQASGRVNCELTTAHAIFLRRRWEVGGAAFVLIQVGSGAYARLYLIRGCDVQYLLTKPHESTLADLNMLRSLSRHVQEDVFSVIKKEHRAQQVVHGRL